MRISLNLVIMRIDTIDVSIQGPLRTPKTPFLKDRIWLEVGASADQALKLPIPLVKGLQICPLI